jgi:hypothetical protein
MQYRLGCGDARLEPAAGHDHVRAASGERAGDRQPETAAPPGDDRDLVGQVE